MLTVLDDATAESALAAGELRCPSCCTGRLRRWGYARRRQLRHLRLHRLQLHARSLVECCRHNGFLMLL